MKKGITILLCLIIAMCLSACSYNPPEGWTKQHHTYKDVLEFTKTIDPNAIVAEEHTDTTDEYDWKYREWDAVINGVNCHVASVSDWVWNDGLSAGEFAKDYYRIVTDYDYIVLNNLLSEKYPDWKIDQDIRSKYHHNENMILVELEMSEYRMLNVDELEQFFQTTFDINKEYEKYAIARRAGFGIPSPAKYWNYEGEKESYVKKDSYTYIEDFTKEGKEIFLKQYQEDWALLESGLPVYD